MLRSNYLDRHEQRGITKLCLFYANEYVEDRLRMVGISAREAKWNMFSPLSSKTFIQLTSIIRMKSY